MWVWVWLQQHYDNFMENIFVCVCAAILQQLYGNNFCVYVCLQQYYDNFMGQKNQVRAIEQAEQLAGSLKER